jgi:hypothetical protein
VCKKLLHTKSQKQEKMSNTSLATAVTALGSSPPSPRLPDLETGFLAAGSAHHRRRSVLYGSPEGSSPPGRASSPCPDFLRELAHGERALPCLLSGSRHRRPFTRPRQQRKRRNDGEEDGMDRQCAATASS